MCRSTKGFSFWKSSQLGHPASDSRTPPETSLKGWKPLMSIALADLEKRRTRFSIDMQDLAVLKRCVAQPRIPHSGNPLSLDILLQIAERRRKPLLRAGSP